MHQFVRKLKISTLDLFLFKSPSRGFLSKRISGVNFKHLSCCNFTEKFRIFLGNDFFKKKLEKPNFGPLLVKKIRNKIFPSQKLFKSVLNLYLRITSCKKPKKLHTLIFNITWKASISALFNLQMFCQ